MTKYRIRLKNERVIGPFDLNQILELKSKGHIQGNEDTQVFPLGEWKPMSTFEFHENLMDVNRTVIQSGNEDATFVIDLSQIRQKRNEKEIEKISSDAPGPAVSNLTETIRMSSTKVSAEIEKVKAPPSATISQEIDLKTLEPERDDKTLINPVAQEEIQRMRKLQAQQEEEARAFEESKNKELLQRKENSRSHKSLVVSSSDATQVISLNNKTELLNRAQLEELNIDREVQDFLQKRKEEDGELEEDIEEEEATNSEDAAKAKKKRVIIAIAVIALLYVFLFPEDEKNNKPPFRHLAPQIVFAVPFDKKIPRPPRSFTRKGWIVTSSGHTPTS